MTGIAILQFSPVPAYFSCGWVKSGVATIVQGMIVQGDICPRDFCPMTQLSKETIVQWDFCPTKDLPVKSLLKLFFLIFYWK